MSPGGQNAPGFKPLFYVENIESPEFDFVQVHQTYFF